MSQDNSLDVQGQLAACYRCHASKVRCRRAPGQMRCQRCTRAAYSDCHPRPSRRGRIGQQHARGLSRSATQKEVEESILPTKSGDLPVEQVRELCEQRHDINADDPLLDLIAASVASGGDGLSDFLWNPLDCDFDPDSLHGTLALDTTTPSRPSTSNTAMSVIFSSALPDSATASSASSSRNEGRDTCWGVGASERWGSRNDFGLELSRLSSASYMQALTDLNAQMFSQQDDMLEYNRQFLAALPKPSYSFPPPATATGELSRRSTPSSDMAFDPICESPVEAALRLGLALRSLLRPHQACERDMPTALFLLSTVLRLASLFHDLLARLQVMLAQETNKKALCTFVFPPVRLGSLLLDERFDDRLRPLQMHSIAMALSTVEGLIDEVIQLTETSLLDHINDGSGAMDDEEGNARDDFGLQALTQALVAKQEAVADSVSGLRDMLCCS